MLLIPKKGKDLSKPESYRPMSLRNVDYKIFVSVLVARLNGFTGEYDGEDQVGFLKHRYKKNCMQRVMNLIEIVQIRKEPVLFYFLDAAKAFDRVEWNFLIEVLWIMGFGPGFLSWIRMIYSKPEVNILIEGFRSNQIDFCRGVRHGCPLSPLLFELMIEILALKVRQNENIHGIQLGTKEFKLTLYADDVVCSISNLVESMRELMEVLGLFGRLSEYQVNQEKLIIKGVQIRKNIQDQIGYFTNDQ